MRFLKPRNIKYSVLLLSLLSFSVMAQSGDRSQTWDVGLQLTGNSSDTLSGDMNSFLSIDSEIGFGFWGTYNLNNRLGFGFDFNWSQPRYTARLVPENGTLPIDINHRMDLFSGQAKAVFNFLEGPITPYIEAGLGLTRVDSNVADSPPTTGCWWSPWGYICDTFYSTYGDTVTSYSGAVGLRWDLNRYYTMRADYGLLVLDTKSGVTDVELEMWRLEFGWRF
jgi:Outer membrane protein beta-barrel domain